MDTKTPIMSQVPSETDFGIKSKPTFFSIYILAYIFNLQISVLGQANDLPFDQNLRLTSFLD